MSERGEFQGIVGYFTAEDAIRQAAERAREAGFEAHARLPLGDHSVVDTLRPQGSPVRWVATAGGLLGIATALAMTIWMSWDYPLVVGGKPITSWPPFLVVSFELMVLFGSIASVVGFLYYARLPALTPCNPYTPDAAVDRLSLFLRCPETGHERARADQLLRQAGAVEVRPVFAMHYTPLQPVNEGEE